MGSSALFGCALFGWRRSPCPSSSPPCRPAMGGGFDHAQNAAKADRERLQSRALDLQRRVAAPGLEKKEINALTEELHGVIERLALTQHSLDTVSYTHLTLPTKRIV